VTTLLLDTETFSATPIKRGAYRYSEDCEILLVAWARDDERVRVTDLTASTDPQAELEALQRMIDAADRVTIHNSAFDRTVLRHHGVVIPVEKIVDPMVIALQHALPGSLDKLCELLSVPRDLAKDKDGKKLIHLFCKPLPKNRKLARATRETHPDEWSRFIEYARLDVDAMRAVLARLPRWNDCHSERLLWRLDQNTNDLGVACDTELASAALRAFRRAGGALASAASRLTAGDVTSTTQRDKLLAYLLRERDFEIADMRSATVLKALEDDTLDPLVRELLENRKEAAATSPSKYQALLGSVCRDGRLRGTIQYAGASRTLRDAGRIFQPQNLPRCPDWFDADEQERTVQAFKLDCEDLVYDDVVDRCAYAIRGCIVAEPGCKLVIADLSNIEGRVAAWLAGENWKLEAFRAYDRGEGPDIYKVSAGRIIGKRPEEVTKAERQNPGKVSELSGAYGGSLGAYRKMGGALLDGMSDDEVMVIVRAWRDANPMIRNLWYDLERAAKAAIQNPDKAYVVRAMQFEMRRDPGGTPWLLLRKPNGRFLCYRNPAIDDGEISYEGMNQYTRKWERLRTYGAKFLENLSQAVARDVFKVGSLRAVEAGYKIVLPVHDELVCEVPDKSEFTAEGLSAIMAQGIDWAEGLPLAAEGFTSYRYRK
jgi:DNA polymerase